MLKVLRAYRKIDEKMDAISEERDRVSQALEHQESRVIRLLRENYPGRAVICGGKAHVMVDGSLYVMDVIDLDSGTDVAEMPDLTFRSVNPMFNPFDVEDCDLSVVSDGAAS